MTILRVLESCLYADDLVAAEAFYCNVLGLAVYSRVPERHVFFRCGPGMFLVFNPQRTAIATGDVPTHGAHGPGHVAFAIEPAALPTWRERLHAQRIAIETEISWPGGGHSLYFRDPAGNSVELATPQTWTYDA
jgi:catechol 2,3-dioxygenase-like lactoylglutathione lyase family enzyme